MLLLHVLYHALVVLVQNVPVLVSIIHASQTHRVMIAIPTTVEPAGVTQPPIACSLARLVITVIVPTILVVSHILRAT